MSRSEDHEGNPSPEEDFVRISTLAKKYIEGDDFTWLAQEMLDMLWRDCTEKYVTEVVVKAIMSAAPEGLDPEIDPSVDEMVAAAMSCVQEKVGKVKADGLRVFPAKVSP